jgi:hypothetical protein
MPGYMLSDLFRAKMRDALSRAGLAHQIAPAVWGQRWTVHVQQIGHGDHALRYLARYVFHVALTNARLIRFDHDHVTFRYTHARTPETRHLTLPVDAFIERFLHHVLPRRFTKIRYFGLLSPGCRAKLDDARHLLELHVAPAPGLKQVSADAPTADTVLTDAGPFPTRLQCRVCQRGHLHLIERIDRPRAPP